MKEVRAVNAVTRGVKDEPGKQETIEPGTKFTPNSVEEYNYLKDGGHVVDANATQEQIDAEAEAKALMVSTLAAKEADEAQAAADKAVREDAEKQAAADAEAERKATEKAEKKAAEALAAQEAADAERAEKSKAALKKAAQEEAEVAKPKKGAAAVKTTATGKGGKSEDMI